MLRRIDFKGGISCYARASNDVDVAAAGGGGTSDAASGVFAAVAAAAAPRSTTTWYIIITPSFGKSRIFPPFYMIRE